MGYMGMQRAMEIHSMIRITARSHMWEYADRTQFLFGNKSANKPTITGRCGSAQNCPMPEAARFFGGRDLLSPVEP